MHVNVRIHVLRFLARDITSTFLQISSRDALVERLSLARDFVYRLNIEKLRPANWISAERPSLTTSSTSSVAISVTTADTKSTTTSHSSRTRDGSGKLTSASTVLRPATATSSNKPHSVSGSLLELKQAKRVPVKENEMRTEEANHVDMRTVLGELKNVLSITLQYGYVVQALY